MTDLTLIQAKNEKHCAQHISLIRFYRRLEKAKDFTDPRCPVQVGKITSG